MRKDRIPSMMSQISLPSKQRATSKVIGKMKGNMSKKVSQIAASKKIIMERTFTSRINKIAATYKQRKSRKTQK